MTEDLKRKLKKPNKDKPTIGPIYLNIKATEGYDNFRYMLCFRVDSGDEELKSHPAIIQCTSAPYSRSADCMLQQLYLIQAIL